jgi:hypothetical protein
MGMSPQTWVAEGIKFGLVAALAFGILFFSRGFGVWPHPGHHQRMKEIGILLSNNERQHRSLHIQKDMLPYALG